MRVFALVVIGSGVFAVGTPALAQAPVEAAVEGVSPSFALMDVDGARSTVETEIGMGFSTDGGSGQLWHGRLRAQMMFDRTFGLYGTLQGGAVSGDGGDVGVSNPEIGGVMHVRTGATTAVSLHAGAVFSLLNDDPFGVQIASIAFRPSDLALVIGGTSWLRGGASATYHDRWAFARLDVGVDQQIDGDSDNDNETLLHINAGIGFGNKQWSAAAELQALFVDDDSVQTAGVSVHYQGMSAAPYVSITRPIGDNLFDDLILVSAGAAFF
jgi:hypothetical protein